MNKRIPILIGLILMAFAIWVQLTSLHPVRNTMARLENLAYDLQLRTKIFVHKKLGESPIVIVDIDDVSLEKEGRWPWPRSKIAKLVTILQNEGAVVIAFDILFPEKQDNNADQVLDTIKKQALDNPSIASLFEKIRPHFDDDAKLSDTLKHSDIALGMTFIPKKKTIGILPPPSIMLNTPAEKELGFVVAPGYIADVPILQTAAKNAGFLNVFPDADGIIRRVPLLIRYQDGLYPSLALEAVRLFLLSEIKLVTASYGENLRIEGIQLENHLIPTDTKSQVIIPFVGKVLHYPTFLQPMF
jgi:adenylate cyclase